MCGAEFAAAEAVFFFGEDDDGAAFGSFIGERGKLRGVGQLGFGDAGRGMKGGGFAIAEGDGAGFVEEQHVDIAGGFDGAAGHGDDVALNQAIHACDADGGEQAADGGGNQADEKRDEREDALRRAGVDGEGLQRDDGEQKNDGEAREQEC